MTTPIAEVVTPKYDTQQLANASASWKWYKNESRIKETYDLYFDADYKTSVWRWKAYYHSLVKEQRQHKKNKDRAAVLGTRRRLEFLLTIRKYGKDQYKASIQK